MRDKIQIKWEQQPNGDMGCYARLTVHSVQVVDKGVYQSMHPHTKREIEGIAKDSIMRAIHEPIESRRNDLMRMMMTIRQQINPAFYYNNLEEEILKPLMDLLNNHRNE